MSRLSIMFMGDLLPLSGKSQWVSESKIPVCVYTNVLLIASFDAI